MNIKASFSIIHFEHADLRRKREKNTNDALQNEREIQKKINTSNNL